jgi:hypothetical protein
MTAHDRLEQATRRVTVAYFESITNIVVDAAELCRQRLQELLQAIGDQHDPLAVATGAAQQLHAVLQDAVLQDGVPVLLGELRDAVLAHVAQRQVREAVREDAIGLAEPLVRGRGERQMPQPERALLEAGGVGREISCSRAYPSSPQHTFDSRKYGFLEVGHRPSRRPRGCDGGLGPRESRLRRATEPTTYMAGNTRLTRQSSPRRLCSGRTSEEGRSQAAAWRFGGKGSGKRERWCGARSGHCGAPAAGHESHNALGVACSRVESFGIVLGFPHQVSARSKMLGVDGMHAKKLVYVVGVAAWVALFGALSLPAEAGGLKAQIFLTQAKIPSGLTEKGLIGFAKANNQKLLRESTDAAIKERKWKSNMVISFNKPADDMEFTVLFYDVHDGPRRFVEDMSIMVNKKTEKTYVQPITLYRPNFKPNRNMELVVTVRREEVGRLKFGVMGEEIKRSGQVSFSDDEAGAKKK